MSEASSAPSSTASGSKAAGPGLTPVQAESDLGFSLSWRQLRIAGRCKSWISPLMSWLLRRQRPTPLMLSNVSSVPGISALSDNKQRWGCTTLMVADLVGESQIREELIAERHIEGTHRRFLRGSRFPDRRENLLFL